MREKGLLVCKLSALPQSVGTIQQAHRFQACVTRNHGDQGIHYCAMVSLPLRGTEIERWNPLGG